MTRRSIGLMLAPVLVVAFASIRGPGAGGNATMAASSGAALQPLSLASSPEIQQKGRYKKQGNNCVWDENDSGPNQCTPQIKGRFKKGANDACVWDADDVGTDQCRPPKGRWKKGGDNSCVWDANDGGPDQCNPRHAR